MTDRPDGAFPDGAVAAEIVFLPIRTIVEIVRRIDAVLDDRHEESDDLAPRSRREPVALGHTPQVFQRFTRCVLVSEFYKSEESGDPARRNPGSGCRPLDGQANT